MLGWAEQSGDLGGAFGIIFWALGGLRFHLGSFGGPWGGIWAHLGGLGEHFGSCLGTLRGHFCSFGGALGGIWIHLGSLGVFWVVELASVSPPLRTLDDYEPPREPSEYSSGAVYDPPREDQRPSLHVVFTFLFFARVFGVFSLCGFSTYLHVFLLKTCNAFGSLLGGSGGHFGDLFEEHKHLKSVVFYSISCIWGGGGPFFHRFMRRFFVHFGSETGARRTKIRRGGDHPLPWTPSPFSGKATLKTTSST